MKHISLERRKLFIVWNKAMNKAKLSKDSVKIRNRLRKALTILQSNDYYQAEKAKYHPTYYSCNCPDWQFHLRESRGYTGPCCHMAAEIILGRIKKLSYSQLALPLEQPVEFTGRVWLPF